MPSIKASELKAEILLVGLDHRYQWRESVSPTTLEHEQRKKFIGRITQEIKQFQPNIVVDETPDTDNEKLLALLPVPPVPVDISDTRKLERQFDIERSIHFVCPYVDSIRERYWRYRLHCLVTDFWAKNQSAPRVLMFVGALHLEASFQRKSFPDQLAQEGYAVKQVNLYKEAGWDHSWVGDWKHPAKPSDWKPRFKCCTISSEFPYQSSERCHYKTYWKEFLANRK